VHVVRQGRATVAQYRQRDHDPMDSDLFEQRRLGLRQHRRTRRNRAPWARPTRHEDPGSGAIAPAVPGEAI
jgi:hypothetical protein